MMAHSATLTVALEQLLSQRTPSGHWVGELSSSALSTATAACALELCRRERSEDATTLESLVAGALAWIARHQNEDGGWGDTVESPSNISTTILCWAALGMVPESSPAETVEQAEDWIRKQAGGLSADCLTECLVEAYGDDRTFSIPILTMCALSGRFGQGRDAWRTIQAIPFELGAVPQEWMHRIGLPMVSYALPALIAIGQVKHHQRPSINPIARMLRSLTRRKTLQVLDRIQPSGGGFLEAAPLTSFVTMSLVGCGQSRHPVVDRAIGFLAGTVRADGSWPIDTNLATWLTTLSINALASGGRLTTRLSTAERSDLLVWLLDQQGLVTHPYTAAAAGGWAWTDLSGGVPDADDTAGALIAIRNLLSTDADSDQKVTERAWMGVRWLLDLQNRDGGIPTFCRGWGRLPFDRSSPDLTAHALRAWAGWRTLLQEDQQARIDQGTERSVKYLLTRQDETGSWDPLWFGNQHDSKLKNPLYGTSRVLLAGKTVVGEVALQSQWVDAIHRGRDWMLAAQNQDGGWGGGPSIDSSIEETALALEALNSLADAPANAAAIERGIDWLQRGTSGGTRFPTTPIGLYFARLWYSERLYPLIFTVSALERASM